MALDIGVFGARGIPSTYSGYETFLTTLLPELAARGHRVTMYCRKGEVDGAEPYRGVHRVVLPAVAGKHASTLSHGAVASVWARRGRHDALLVVNPANAVFCAVGRLTGQPVVLNTDGQEWLRGKWGRIGRSWFRYSARLAGWCATGLVADCQAMADVYVREFHAPSTVIPYCFPSIDCEPDASELDAHGVMRGAYFVTGGRLNPENNIHCVARAYAESDLALPLLVCGTANYDSPVERQLDEIAHRDPRIRVIGHVGNRRGFLTLLGAATAYVHGHSVGGTNPSLVEAMRASALIVALDTSFNRETLGDAGLYFPGGIGEIGDVVSVLRRVRSLSVEQATALRTAAATRVAERFDVESVVDAYEHLLAASVGRRGHALVVPTRWAT
ncbi:MAG: glycosyltransferase [Acidimicrobiales bacterium]